MQKLAFYTVMLAILVLPVLMIRPLLSAKGPKERCMQVTFFSEPGCGPPNPHPLEISYREFALTADTGNNSVVFRNLRAALKSIRETGDKHRGIRIRISDKASFQDYITTLDICRAEETVPFALLPGDVLIPSVPDLQEPLPPCLLVHGERHSVSGGK